MKGNVISVDVKGDRIITRFVKIKDGKFVLTADRDSASVFTKEAADEIIGKSKKKLEFIPRI